MGKGLMTSADLQEITRRLVELPYTPQVTVPSLLAAAAFLLSKRE